MSEALVIFSLGPVQSFIAEARRTRDLWAGSRLLSDVTRAAIQAFQKEGAQIIYPADPAQESLPNKFVVRIPAEKVQQAAQSAQRMAQRALEDIAEQAKSYLRRKGVPIDMVWEAIWERQLQHHLEFFWAAAMIEGDYQKAYAKASRAFEATKRTRIFAQSEEEGPKDSLSGRRSALHTDGVRPREYWREVGELVEPSELRPEGRERLDALGITKRFGYGGVPLPSTSSVAAASFLKKIRGTDKLQNYRFFIQAIPLFYRVSDDPDWPYDGDLFFRETFSPDRLQDDYRFTPEDLERYALSLEAIRLALEMLYEATRARPSPYYAILVMDGDSMGKHVGSCTSAEEHSELSAQLITFAQKAQDIIKAHQGTPIYTGGDDVLALLPLASAFQAVVKLAETYRQLFSGWTQKYPHHTLPFTASAGISVVHHRYPLGAALQAAREAERRAKGVKDKDALAVAVLRRSGERTEMRSPWRALGSRFERLRAWFSNGALSSRFAYDVADSARRLKGLEEPFRAELKRLLRRHRDEQKPNPPDPEEVADDLMDWAQSLPERDFEELANWILLARFVAQGGVI
jgi:CRISPR-associated protein Cmr2